MIRLVGCGMILLCFDHIVIHGYLSGLSRPEQVVYFFRQVVGVPAGRPIALPLMCTSACSGRGSVQCQERLGGLLKYYQRRAA